VSALFLHPAFWLFIGIVVVFANRRRMPGMPVGVIVALGALLALLRGVEGTLETTVAGFRLVWFHADRLSLLFALVFAIVALLGFLYGSHRMRAGETAAALLYAGSAIATVLAGDWITFFVFWEAMALSSLALIWQAGTAGARRAGMRYLLVHATGGALLFAGIALHLAGGGEPSLGALASDSPPFWLILGAVAINAAIPPLHAWLTDAYPEASTSGSVFLSAFTTKTAVYALLRLFPGTEILVPLGAAMALYGVVFAVIENDIRRLLGYHIVSQVGYMVAAVGIGTPLALNGAASHAFSHILYKALLFMGAGAAIEATGLRRLSDLGGISRQMRARRSGSMWKPEIGGKSWITTGIEIVSAIRAKCRKIASELHFGARGGDTMTPAAPARSAARQRSRQTSRPGPVAPTITGARPSAWAMLASRISSRSRSEIRATSLVTPRAVKPETPSSRNRSITRPRLGESKLPSGAKGVGRTE